ncbi:unnamed protein product [Cylicocyclus nassatus]|uniref:Uncharacterized protein n=1 Tax=Cylicocyclus nassatus TaxID=53992 RepID=A0AA36DNC7_CYLNA|nr:unnamed protein product [Cylicocyclus nassatus]
MMTKAWYPYRTRGNELTYINHKLSWTTKDPWCYKHELRELLHCAEFAPSPLLVFVSAFFQGIAATYFIINAFIFGALAAWRHSCTLMRRLHAAGGAFVHPSPPPPVIGSRDPPALE